MSLDLYTNICINRPKFDDEDVSTITSLEQKRTELSCIRAYSNYARNFKDETKFKLWRTTTIRWLHLSLANLSHNFQGLYASQAWLCYWTLHTIELLDGFSPSSAKLIDDAVTLLLGSQNATGGFGGGPRQESHLLSTYAAVSALFICAAHGGDAVATRVKDGINVTTLRQYFLRMKIPASNTFNYGGFTVHEDGEVDTRGLYCLLAVASLVHIIDDELIAGSAEWLGRCQGFDGGIGGEPFNEPHGGYTFCGVAAAILLKKPTCIDLEKVLKWAALRQQSLEGGFCGRTNKLVDGCYSYWVGGVFPIVHFAKLMANGDDSNIDAQNNASAEMKTKTYLQLYAPNPEMGWLFNQRSLQQYILGCCQSSEERPGLMDKPGAGVDFYHTAYCLSGLALAQQSFASPNTINVYVPVRGKSRRDSLPDSASEEELLTYISTIQVIEPSPHVLGESENMVEINNHLYNLTEKTMAHIMNLYSQVPVTIDTGVATDATATATAATSVATDAK